jgi:hypothetical protein
MGGSCRARPEPPAWLASHTPPPGNAPLLVAPARRRVHRGAWLRRCNGYDERSGQLSLADLIQRDEHAQLRGHGWMSWRGSVPTAVESSRPWCTLGRGLGEDGEGHDALWAKLCFELSPQHQPMIVSVVTWGTSGDCNAAPSTGRWSICASPARRTPLRFIMLPMAHGGTCSAPSA